MGHLRRFERKGGGRGGGRFALYLANVIENNVLTFENFFSRVVKFFCCAVPMSVE